MFLLTFCSPVNFQLVFCTYLIEFWESLGGKVTWGPKIEKNEKLKNHFFMIFRSFFEKNLKSKKRKIQKSKVSENKVGDTSICGVGIF